MLDDLYFAFAFDRWPQRDRAAISFWLTSGWWNGRHSLSRISNM